MVECTGNGTVTETNSDYMPAEMDLEIHRILNEFRAEPKSIIPILEDMIPRFKGKVLKRPGKVDLMTNEGVTVVKETIEYLKKVKKCEIPLSWRNELSLSTRDHVLS